MTGDPEDPSPAEHRDASASAATPGPAPRGGADEPVTAAREKGLPTWTPLLVLLPAIVALGALLGSLLLPGSSPAIGEVRGVRLGMTPDQVRERFDRGAPSSWRTEIAGTDLSLIRAPSGSLDREARFEFHEGMLVAMRFDLSADAPEASGDPITISTASVTARTRGQGGRVSLVVLARDCPTHAEEVSRILSDGG